MLSAVMQPTFNPWMGYFDLMDQVETFVFLDDVQLSKQGWQTRNRIKTPQGELFLSIPLKRDVATSERLINTARIADHLDWRLKHLKTIAVAYRKAAFFDEIFPLVEQHYKNPCDLIAEFNITLIRNLSSLLGITTRIMLASEIPNISGRRDERVATICKAIGSNEYISPKGSAEYINSAVEGGAFAISGIELYYHEYDHPQYPQLYNPFISHLGILDLLFNVGTKAGLHWIRKGRKVKSHYRE